MIATTVIRALLVFAWLRDEFKLCKYIQLKPKLKISKHSAHICYVWLDYRLHPVWSDDLHCIVKKRYMEVNLNMFVFPVASGHDQSIICPGNNFQCVMREAILFNYEAMVSSSLERAAGQVIKLTNLKVGLFMLVATTKNSSVWMFDISSSPALTEVPKRTSNI